MYSRARSTGLIRPSALPPLPELRTERLWLRAMELRDAPDVFEYARNPDVLRYTTGTAPREVSETEAFLKGALSDPTTYFWAIRDHPNGPVVGGIELGVGAPEVGRLDYAMAASHWSRGLTTEAVRAVTTWAFASIPRLARIESAVVPENVGSWRVLEKCGFNRIGETTEHWAKQREPVRLWHYRLVRPR